MDAFGPPLPLSFHIALAPPAVFNCLMGVVPAHLERLEDFHGLKLFPPASTSRPARPHRRSEPFIFSTSSWGLPDGDVEDIVERCVASCDLLVVFLDSQSSSRSTKHELTGRL